MYLFLLKKALPFTLTFIFGAVLSGLTGLFGASEKKAESVFSTRTRTYEFGSRCRMRRRHLVAESKPLTILNVPDARVPRGFVGEGVAGVVPVKVTFGADGTVRKVEAADLYARNDVELPPRSLWDAVEKAAKQIQFTPETINSVPVSVEREVEIHFIPE
jgi:hypothetical protein